MGGFYYNRKNAVHYAEKWWDDQNPEYRHFTDDCTNYISQCLFAGGMVMHGAPERTQGWWYHKEGWSLSWSVAHSFYWYCKGEAQKGNVLEVARAKDLQIGDIICYDFQGDARYDHTAIVVAKKPRGSPLVNAHTVNSRHRRWSYTDSVAWTPNINYAFFHIP